MARRSLSEAAKVVIAAVALGPPLGGVIVMTVVALLQVLPWLGGGSDILSWLASGGAGGVNSSSLLQLLAGMVLISYYAGGVPAVIAGLALAAYVAWGCRLTLWACLVASLIYPALLAASGLLATWESPEAARPALGYAAMVAVASYGSALVCYLLLHRTALVRRLNAPAEA